MGRWGVPTHSRACGGEGDARASPSEPIYRLAMAALATRYFSCCEVIHWCAHSFES